MKNTIVAFVIGLILFLILVIGWFTIFNREEAVQPAIVVPVNPTITYLENGLVEAEATYQAEWANLQQARQQQQNEHQNQVETLQLKLVAAQKQLDELNSEEQALSTQVEQLEATRAAKQIGYKNDLEQARNEYGTKPAQLQSQLDQILAELAETEVGPSQ
jgi:DNA repair exonuclease SbcCD ATPase subunit